ncbi:hypothetical protein FLA_4662 [Filimonas lacunae]|nr:hypothetical protein FLA_4662 [Filimonas lacunae]
MNDAAVNGLRKAYIQQYTPKEHSAAYTDSTQTGAFFSLFFNKPEQYI